MFEVSATTEVEAPPSAVWKVFEDPHRYPEISVATDRMIDVPDVPIGRDSTYKEYGGVRPFKAESSWRVTEFDPHRRQVHVGDDGSYTLEMVVETEETARGCQLAMSFGAKPRWYMVVPTAILWPIMMRQRTQKVIDETVENIGRAAETVA